MKELYESAKQIILNNYKGDLDEETLDILTVSVMALFARFSDVSQKRIPEILNKLEIHFGDKSISEMVSDRYPEYPIGEIGEHTNAFVTRAMKLGDDNKFDEEWTMFVSKSAIKHDSVNIVAKTTHELVHLLRFNGIIDSDTEAKIRDGFSVGRVNKETKVLKRKHYNFEEGVVEHFTIKSMENLYELIKNEDVSFSPVLSTFKSNFETNFKKSYEIERFFLDGLLRDKKFEELLEYSFVDQSEPLTLVTHFNNVVGDASGFTRLSRTIDRVVDCATAEDTANFQKNTEDAIKQINGFLAKTKR